MNLKSEFLLIIVTEWSSKESLYVAIVNVATKGMHHSLL